MTIFEAFSRQLDSVERTITGTYKSNFQKLDKHEVFITEKDGKRKRRSPSWGKMVGSVSMSLVKTALSLELQNGYPKLDVVGPDCYIQHFPMECDLLVVERGTKSLRFEDEYETGFSATGIFPIDKVVAAVEIKRRGIIMSTKDVEPAVKKLSDMFQNVRLHPNSRGRGFRYAFLSIEEISKPKNGFNYAVAITEGIKPFEFFMLREYNKTTDMSEQQERWNKFVHYLGTGEKN